MQKITVYEFKDLERDTQAKVRDKEIEEEIEFQLNFLGERLEKKDITEKDYYKELGCSKYYAESTAWFVPRAWFVPSCYYKKNMELVNENVEMQLQEMLFTKEGNFIKIK